MDHQEQYIRFNAEEGPETPGLLPDWRIFRRWHFAEFPDAHPGLRAGQGLTIRPFVFHTKEPKQPSYGLSSYGYDLRLSGKEAKVFSDTAGIIVDPTEIDDSRFAKYHDFKELIVPPNSFALCVSLEYMEIPTDCIGLVLGKSTFARCGTILNMTPLEPGWRGHVTIEVANQTRLPLRLRPGWGIGQVLFFQGAAPCLFHYGMKQGSSYQDQADVPVLPRV